MNDLMIFLTHYVVNIKGRQIDINVCYLLVRINFAPICKCKNNRRIWRHSTSTSLCVKLHFNCADAILRGWERPALATMVDWAVEGCFQMVCVSGYKIECQRYRIMHNAWLTVDKDFGDS